MTDTDKRMPLIELEIFGPILNYLSMEVTGINEVLLKILDMKTELLNSVTVRQMSKTR